jgi:hypothetical protein
MKIALALVLAPVAFASGGHTGVGPRNGTGDGVHGVQDGCFEADIDGRTVTVQIDVTDTATGESRISADVNGDEMKGTATGTPDVDGGMASSDSNFSDGGETFRVKDNKMQVRKADATWADMSNC